MSISNLLLAIWLILVGVTWLTWVNIDIKFLGLLGFVTGILLLVESYHPINIRRPQVDIISILFVIILIVILVRVLQLDWVLYTKSQLIQFLIGNKYSCQRKTAPQGCQFLIDTIIISEHVNGRNFTIRQNKLPLSSAVLCLSVPSGNTAVAKSKKSGVQLTRMFRRQRTHVVQSNDCTPPTLCKLLKQSLMVCKLIILYKNILLRLRD